MLLQNNLLFQFQVKDFTKQKLTKPGRAICKAAFQIFWHLTHYSLDLVKNCIVAGTELPVHGNFGQDQAAVKEHACGVFLTRLASVSEQQPDSEEIHLVE